MQSDEDYTEQERWAENEAAQMERNRDYLKTECLPGWLKRLDDGQHPENAKQIYEICLKMQNYTELARELRQPRYARLEYEAAERLYRPEPTQ